METLTNKRLLSGPLGWESDPLPNYNFECRCGVVYCARHGRMPTDRELLVVSAKQAGACGRVQDNHICLLPTDHEAPHKYGRDVGELVTERGFDTWR